LADIATSKAFGSALASLLERMAGISPPSWWNTARETHNFALSDVGAPLEAPMNIDLPANLCLDVNNNIVMHDFEKYQWSTAGLQALQFAYCILRECGIEGRRMAFYKEIISQLTLIPRKKLQASWGQLQRIYTSKLVLETSPDPKDHDLWLKIIGEDLALFE
jgi:hypothetical protein